jgi:uncharacterized protein YjbI with pentapeptide repeats
MVGIIALVTSFIIAILGFIHSNKANPSAKVDSNKKAITSAKATLRLTRLGVILIGLSIVGFIAGITKEISDKSKAKETEAREEQTVKLLKEVHAQIVGVKDRIVDPQLAQELETISNRISKAASQARESDFSMSDFSRSNFQFGNFTEANFQGALFRGANLRGADLSSAEIDTDTKLPIGR